MDDNLTDQQRADQVRSWLWDNGWYLLAGLALGVAALFGWRQWDGMRSTEGEAASALFDELVAAVRVNRTERAGEITEQITTEYASTPYADQALLAMARLKMDAAAPDEAARYLERAMQQASSPAIAHIARLRLARVMIQQERAEEALRMLDVPRDSKFAPRYHDVRGDAYYALQKLAEAGAEYKAALDASTQDAPDREYLQAKYDEVAGAAPAGSAAPAAAGPG